MQFQGNEKWFVVFFYKAQVFSFFFFFEFNNNNNYCFVRSYPSTPLLDKALDVYSETNEPMLSSPTLNSLNSGVQANNEISSRNVADLLESNFLGEVDAGEVDSLVDPLGNFDGLQDVDSLQPLFNEVTEPNH